MRVDRRSSGRIGYSPVWPLLYKQPRAKRTKNTRTTTSMQALAKREPMPLPAIHKLAPARILRRTNTSSSSQTAPRRRYSKLAVHAYWDLIKGFTCHILFGTKDTVEKRTLLKR